MLVLDMRQVMTIFTIVMTSIVIEASACLASYYDLHLLIDRYFPVSIARHLSNFSCIGLVVWIVLTSRRY